MNKPKEIGQKLLDCLKENNVSKGDVNSFIDIAVLRLEKSGNDSVEMPISKLKRRFGNLYPTTKINRSAGKTSQANRKHLMKAVHSVFSEAELVEYKAHLQALNESYELERLHLINNSSVLKNTLDLVYSRLVKPPRR